MVATFDIREIGDEVIKVAGHSKWKNIQHRKGRQDARKGKIFHKLAREIYVAVRLGDPDPAHNQRLRLAITKAKSENMPNENIERAIKKAVGGAEGNDYEEVIYEGYGPNGVAILVDSLTDNRNRTSADLRHIFSKNGGNLGEAGSVAWMFERKGVLLIERNQLGEREEEILLLAMEHGAEDIDQSEAIIEIITEPQSLESVQQALEKEKVPLLTAEITFRPTTQTSIDESQLAKFESLLTQLEEHDDVQSVYHNLADDSLN